MKQLISEVIEFQGSDTVNEELVYNAACLGGIWPVDTFPFINSGNDLIHIYSIVHGINVVSIDKDQFDELIQESIEAKGYVIIKNFV